MWISASITYLLRITSTFFIEIVKNLFNFFNKLKY